MKKVAILFYSLIVFIAGFTFYIYIKLPANFPLQKPKPPNLFFNYPVEKLKKGKRKEKYEEKSRKDNLQNQLINPLKNCNLIGTVYPKLALINCNGENKILKIGEKFLNCTLKQVKKDKAIFNCNKISISMTFKIENLDKNLNNLNKDFHHKNFSLDKVFSRNRNLNRDKNLRSTSSSTPENIFHVNRKQVIDLISSGKIFYQMAVTPYYKNGKIIGFRVNGVKRNSFVYKMGIRRGDIILSVNDYPIRSMEEGFAAFERLKRASEINIRVLRRGREITLSYIIED